MMIEALLFRIKPMIKNDTWIVEKARAGMISPFEEHLVRQIDTETQAQIPSLSYGVSSYGYDIRLSPLDFRVFRHIPGTVVDPKNFNPHNLEPIKLQHDPEKGDYFVIPGNSYALGASLEAFDIPSNITAICLGKSTYARCGIIANVTPLEACWRGESITLEFSNASLADVRMYANEGVIQVIFFEGDPCQTSYADRQGKYQDQGKGVTLPRV